MQCVISPGRRNQTDLFLGLVGVRRPDGSSADGFPAADDQRCPYRKPSACALERSTHALTILRHRPVEGWLVVKLAAALVRKTARVFGVHPGVHRGSSRGNCYNRPFRGCPIHSAWPAMAVEEHLGVLQQLVVRHGLGEALAQERLVSRVFQQPSHQIGHAGNQVANRRVEPQPEPSLLERVAYRLRHAIENLVFDPILGHMQLPCHLDDRGDRTDVVRPAGETRILMVLEDAPRGRLEIGIAFVLVRENRHRPVVLPRSDDFRVPIGPFDQPHRDLLPVLASPGNEVRHVAIGVTQIGLHRDAGVRVAVELGLLHQAAVERQRQALEGLVLHVEIDECPNLHRAPHDRPQPLLRLPDRVFESAGAHLRVHCRRLDRDVDLGRRAPIQIGRSGQVATCRFQGSPTPLLAVESVDQSQVTI